MFIVSILLILISSYFILSLIDKKFQLKNNIGFIFYILIAFSQIIISFEVLSLCKYITKNGFLALNLIIFIFSLIIWIKNKCYKYEPKLKQELKAIWKAIKTDKILTFIGYCYIVFIISRLFYALFFPVNYGDAMHYYFPRCTMWIQNLSFLHYITFDTRELIMPINSELTYLWLMLFTKNEIGSGIFPYIFYVNAVFVIYNFLGELGFCRRKRLWSIFVFSSFTLIFIESAIPGADLWSGSLILTCFYLFFCGCKYNKTFLIWLSALSYALAAGVKTTSLIAIPASIFVLIIISLLYSKNSIKKKLLSFTGFFIINFLIFSSYNYILNFIDFKNPISDKSQLLLNAFRGGIKGYISNLIRYTFSAFDFSGMPNFFHLGEYINALQNKVLSIFGIMPDSFSSDYFDNQFDYNSKMHLIESVLGITGFLTFYPAIFIAFIKLIKNKYSKKAILLATLTLYYVINILIFSRVMLFTKYNMRYLLAFIIPASLILVYTYIKKNNNLYKIILAWFLFVILAFYSHTKPFTYIIQFINYKSKPIEQQELHKNFVINDCDELEIFKDMWKKDKKHFGLLMYANRESAIYYIYKLRLFSHNIEVILPEIITAYDLSKYDYIILYKDFLDSTLIKNFEKQNLNKSICLYADNEGHIITPKDNKTPVLVSCNIPYQYLYDNGFYIMENPKLKNYQILKNKNKK